MEPEERTASRTMEREGKFILGANYWPAGKNVYWWREFELSTAKRDFSLAAEYGLDLIRFFLLWDDPLLPWPKMMMLPPLRKA